MVIKKRDDLKELFKNNTVPMSKDFTTLIDSVLVKRDDKFFGVWQPGVGYADGDVVLHNETFYYFKKPTDTTTTEAGCNCDDCGNTAPNDTYSCCWQRLRIDVNDHDWEFIENAMGEKIGQYAKVTGAVGIGTGENATAFFHINDDKNGGGQLLFNPQDTEGGNFPMLKMLNISQLSAVENTDETVTQATPLQASFVSQSLDRRKVIYATDTLGYMFRQIHASENPDSDDEIARFTEGGRPDKILMFITSEHRFPRVGIGTKEPAATLDLHLKGRGQIHADAGEDNEPDLTLVNWANNGSETYFSESIGEKQATLVTNAPKGFLLKSDVHYEDRFRKCGNERAESGTPLMVVKPDQNTTVKVGIGTTKPTTEVEIEGAEGKLQVSLHDYNPAINIVNKVNSNNGITDSNYLSVGVVGSPADEQAVFSTNSKNGFLFKHSTDSAQNAPVGVNFGTGFLCLQCDNAEKGLFSMLLNGRMAAKGFYAAAAPQNAKAVAPNMALKLIQKLKPTSFCLPDETETEYGFRAVEMPNELGSLVRNFDGLTNDVKGIAYQSLVALLVGAVKDLEAKLSHLEEKIEILEKHRRY